MSGPDAAWLTGGRGTPPVRRWSFAADAPLLGLEAACESGDVLAADEAGGLCLLDRRGRVAALTRGFHDLTALAVSDTGRVGAAVLGPSRLCRFDRRLRIEWTLDLPEPVLAVAVDPHGNCTAASLANGTNFVYDAGRRRIAEFATVRPLAFLRFLADEPGLVVAADYGLLARHRLDGAEVWSERLWSNVGDLSVTGDGGSVFVAAFSHGLQRFDADGQRSGSWVVEGTPHRLSTSFAPARLAVATLERHVYWLDAEGQLVWATLLPDDVFRLHTHPLGSGLVCGFSGGRIVSLAWRGPIGSGKWKVESGK